MPGTMLHKKLSLNCLGQYTPWLHASIDAPVRGELKSQHRRFFHDWDFVQFLGRKWGRELAREALLHIILDLEEKGVVIES
ncbi:MAG: hypothetical protein DDT24_00071 [Chloroflexi bacterium]|nr:hypothetical protein [Chloroflexota bacterium]MBT9165828.1 hypothetical protein [Chloroflexota bacterium]